MDNILPTAASYNHASSLMSVYSADALKPIKENNQDPERLEKIASEFESQFIYLLLKTMRETVSKSDFLHSMKGEDIYYSIHDYEIAKEASRHQGIGLAALLLKELKTA